MELNENIQENKLQQTAPKLFSVNKENPFDVPENYFDDLSNKISDKCISSEKSESMRIIYGPIRKVLIPLAIAASVILVILINHRENDNNVIKTVQFAYTDNSSTSDYLESLIDNNELDESLIISELANDDTIKSNSHSDHQEERINALNENPVIINDTINNMTITEDDIIQYLLEEDESDDLLN